MCESPIRYETIVSQIRRDIVTGVYPVGSIAKPVKNIRSETGISVDTGYKIYNILEEEGLVKYTRQKGAVILSFDQEFWLRKIQDEAEEILNMALTICNESKLTREQVFAIFQNAYSPTTGTVEEPCL